jgi:hypothetical protein
VRLVPVDVVHDELVTDLFDEDPATPCLDYLGFKPHRAFSSAISAVTDVTIPSKPTQGRQAIVVRLLKPVHVERCH